MKVTRNLHNAKSSKILTSQKQLTKSFTTPFQTASGTHPQFSYLTSYTFSV